MKHTIQAILLFTCCVFATSCGQNNTERESQSLQHHDDSLRSAIEAEANAGLQRQNDSLKVVASTSASTKVVRVVSNNTQPVNSGTNANTTNNVNPTGLGDKTNALIDDKLQLTRLNALLVNARAKLEYERNELTRTEQFRVGRMKSEREQQIRQQSIRVQAYQNLVLKTQDAILTLNNKIYALQSDISQTN